MKTLGLTPWSPFRAFAAVQLGLLNLLWRNTHITALTGKSLPLCILVLKVVQVEVLIFTSCSKAAGGDSGTWEAWGPCKMH